MRRKDRLVSREEALAIVDLAVFGTMALQDGEETYAVPLSFVRVGEALYFHGARSGRKADILARCPKVGVSFVAEVHVPAFMADVVEDVQAHHPDRVRALLPKLLTIDFASAHIVGKVNMVEDGAEREMGMRRLCERFTPGAMPWFAEGFASGDRHMAVYRVDILSVSGKRKHTVAPEGSC